MVMNPSIHIRKGAPADLPVIAHHRISMMASMDIGDPSTYESYALEFQEFARRSMSDQTYHQWLAETETGKVVSGAAAYVVPWPGNPKDHRQKRVYIINVFTEPEHRRKGIARALLQEIIAWCHDQGFKSVRLVSSEMGVPLYQSLGFQPTREMKLEW
jgi:GNAT superfamily N-acetyltransferase